MDFVPLTTFPLFMGLVAALQLGWYLGVLVLLYGILQELRAMRAGR